MSFNLHYNIFFCLILATQLHSSDVMLDHCQTNCKTEINNSHVNIFYGSRNCESPVKNHVHTTTGHILYPTRFPVSSIKCFSYSIKARNQTYIALFSNNDSPKLVPWVEMVIGGLPNGLGNIISKDGAGINATYNQKQNSLNNLEYRGFWVSWFNGNYRVGYRGEPPFMTWQDPKPFPIVSVGVDTCCDTIGKVVVEEPRCPGINM